jgi:hypothetical protein
MPVPDVTVDIKDGALGILPPNTDNLHVKIGVASLGTLNQLVSVTSLQQVRDTFGSGPLAEALATALTAAGGPVYAMRGQASTAGTVSAVTATRATNSTGTMTVTGSPNDRYDVIVEITRDGTVANGQGAFRYSLDGGDVYSAEIALTASYAIPNTGLTLNFADDATAGAPNPGFNDGDLFEFTSTAPAMTLADLNAAIDALLADSREWSWLHVVGESTPTIAAGVATRMSEAEAAHRYAFALLEARDFSGAEDNAAWQSALIAEWSTFADVRVAVAAGHAELTSPLTGRVHRRSTAWTLNGRLAAIPVHEHAGRVASGPVAGIVSLYHDERATPGLDDEFFATHRTIIGRAGFYVTRGRVKAPLGSDYQFIENRRVMDKGCKIARDAALRFLNENVRVDSAGLIFEADARAIEAYVGGALQGGLISPGNASAASVSLKRDSNVLSTRATTITVRVRPLGYLEDITLDIGFENPARQAAAN